MLTVGTKVLWRNKNIGSKSDMSAGVVAQWRPNPDRVEIVPVKGSAYGEWINEKDLEYIKA